MGGAMSHSGKPGTCNNSQSSTAMEDNSDTASSTGDLEKLFEEQEDPNFGEEGTPKLPEKKQGDDTMLEDEDVEEEEPEDEQKMEKDMEGLEEEEEEGEEEEEEPEGDKHGICKWISDTHWRQEMVIQLNLNSFLATRNAELKKENDGLKAKLVGLKMRKRPQSTSVIEKFGVSIAKKQLKYEEDDKVIETVTLD